MERVAEDVEAPLDDRKRQSEVASNGEDMKGGTYVLTTSPSYIKPRYYYIRTYT